MQFFVASQGGPPGGQAIRVNIEEALTEVVRLPRHVVGDHGRCTPMRRGRSLVLDVHDCSVGYSFAFSEVNLEDLPPTAASNGEVRSLELENGRGLLSSTYCLTFGPDYPDLIGCVLGTGPDVKRLADYLSARCSSTRGKFRIEPLIDADVAGALQRMQAVSLFHLKIDPSQVPVIRGHWNSLDARLDADADLYAEQQYFDVLLVPSISARTRASRFILDGVASLLGVSELLVPNSVLRVKGPLDDTGTRDVIVDLVGRKLLVPVTVAKERNGWSTVDKWSAYSAIRLGHTALGDGLANALQARSGMVRDA